MFSKKVFILSIILSLWTYEVDTGKIEHEKPTLDRSEHNWLVSIYSPNVVTEKFQFICFGNIISKKFILSVAHCFSSPIDGAVNNVSRYMVAAGKQFMEYDDPKDQDYVQKRELSEIIVPTDYKGITKAFSNDIALLKLKDDFIINDFVKEIGLDLVLMHREQKNSRGTVFNYKDKRIQRSSFNVLDILSCESKVPADFINFITSDKFCAESNDFECSGGVAGSGLAKKFDDKLFIRGLLSTGPVANGGCSGIYPVTFTNVSEHLSFINRISN